jgi:hypothetical protein
LPSEQIFHQPRTRAKKNIKKEDRERDIQSEREREREREKKREKEKERERERDKKRHMHFDPRHLFIPNWAISRALLRVVHCKI